MTLYLCIYQPASVPYDTALTRKHVQCASFTSWNHTYAPAHGTYSSWQQEVQIPNDFCTLKLVFICIWIILWHRTWRTSAWHDKCTAWQVSWQVYCMANHDKCTTWRTNACHDKCTAWQVSWQVYCMAPAPWKSPKPACVPNDTKPISENVALYIMTMHL